MILFALIPVLVELLRDYIQLLREGKVTHELGVIFRVICSLILVLIDWKLILVYLSWHILIFDHVMGYLLTSNPFYIGKVSKADRFIRSNRYLSDITVRTFLRIFLASVLSSVYFFPQQYGL